MHFRSAFARASAAAVIVTQVAACATRPSNIDPMYVSPLIYGTATCTQLLGELSTVSGRLAPLEGRLNRNATSDAIWVGVYVPMVVLLPFTFFLIHGNGPEYEKYSWLLGERDAIEQQLHAKQCGP